MSNYTYGQASELAEQVVLKISSTWPGHASHRDEYMAALIDVGYIRCMIATDWPTTDEVFCDIMQSLQDHLDSYN